LSVDGAQSQETEEIDRENFVGRGACKLGAEVDEEVLYAL
jgi:hypothetical protein